MSKANSHKRARRRNRGGECHYCGAPATTVDHVVPISVGGRHSVVNTVPACRPCNEYKGQSMWESHCDDCAGAWAYFRKLNNDHS